VAEEQLEKHVNSLVDCYVATSTRLKRVFEAEVRVDRVPIRAPLLPRLSDRGCPASLRARKARDPWVQMPPKNAAKPSKNGGKGPGP